MLNQDTSALKFFRIRFKKMINMTIQRTYRAMMVLYKVFPDARNTLEESIFDKIYLI